MKSIIVALTALISVSSFAAPTASLTEKDGVQTLTISGSALPRDWAIGALFELPDFFLGATNALKVKRLPDASFFEGKYIEGLVSSPLGRSTRRLTIEQPKNTIVVPGRTIQTIEKNDDGIYEIRGEAAAEIYSALVDSGAVMKKNKKGSVSSVSGDSFSCSANPRGLVKFACTISINKIL